MIRKVSRSIIIWSVDFVFVLIATLFIPYFASYENFANVAVRLLIIFLVALAQSSAIVVGGADLSVGSNMSVMTGIASYLLIVNPILGIAVILLAGAALGAFNGFGVSKLNIHPFIVTLCAFLIAQGLALTLRPIPGGEIPRALYTSLYSTYYGIPVLSIILLLTFLFMFVFFIERTSLGRSLLAVGGNEKVAQDFGVNTARVKFLAYVLSGVLAALAGFFLGVRIGCGSPNVGETFLLYSFGAAVAGGTYLTGGVTSPVGTLGGALLFALIDDILWLAQVSPYLSLVVQGIMLAVVVGISEVVLRR
ncbi:TPA: ABC transporter permease [Candidatus Poribacteria bacterium]|nr:ABC transporter permease [Candidatus Poribacteria bacterium]